MGRILIVDDDAQIRQLFKRILEEKGHQVFIAVDGEDGIIQYKKEKPDLMLLDIIMPNKEGIEVIREITSEYKNAKIIAVSGGGKGKAVDYLSYAKHFGAKQIIEKPVSPSKLIESINKILEQ